jgi:hypothetical protein
MPLRVILIAVVAVIAAAVGIIFYAYSLSPVQKPVHVEIPNDQFPQ